MRRRRDNKKTKRAPAKRYESVFEFDYYDLLKDCETAVYYIGWYDASARQTRRRSLHTTDRRHALETVDRIDKSGATGDPISMLNGRIDIASVLRAYETAHAGAASAEFNRVVIEKHLIPRIGHIEVSAWKRKQDFKQFEQAFLGQGHSLGYFSRICAVLRAALREAEDDERIPYAPRIPEPMTEQDRDDAPLKGRVMTPAEIARLIDQVDEHHFLNYLIAAINSGGRPVTIVEADTCQIDWTDFLFDTNAPGRRQTKKYRPTIRISATWEPWLKATPPGPLVAYRGKPVKSLKTAFRKARDAAGLQPDADGVHVTGYSLRHSL